MCRTLAGDWQLTGARERVAVMRRWRRRAGVQLGPGIAQVAAIGTAALDLVEWSRSRGEGEARWSWHLRGVSDGI
jgi:hypothetical protein